MEFTIKDKYGIEFRVIGKGKFLKIWSPNEEIIGRAQLAEYRPSVEDIYIEEEYRRRGICTALYDQLEIVLGFQLEPYSIQYRDGRLFWANRKERRGSE